MEYLLVILAICGPYLGIAFAIYCVLDETVLEDFDHESPKHAVIAFMWPFIVLEWVVHLFFPESK